MKARIKDTGEIVEIVTFLDNDEFPTTYDEDELEFGSTKFDDEYWEKLRHQYAGMALQGMLANGNQLDFRNDDDERFLQNRRKLNPYALSERAVAYANALINKLVEENTDKR